MQELPMDHSEFSEGCRCDGGQPKNFLRPCLLLLLAEQNAHGYELLERLKPFGFSRDPGGLYRVLRSMEQEGLVASQWLSSAAGPDRCQYRLTPLGGEWLGAWADTLDETRRTLEGFLRRYITLSQADTRHALAEPVTQPDGPRVTLDDAAAFRTIIESTRPRFTGR